MKTHIVKIGNSKGIRIPKPILEQCNLQNEIEMEVENNQLIIRASYQPRKKWESYFRTMRDNEDDELLIDDLAELSSWETTEWDW